MRIQHQTGPVNFQTAQQSQRSQMGSNSVKVTSKEESKGLSTIQKVAIGVGVAAVAYGTAYGIRKYQGEDVNADIVKGFNATLAAFQGLSQSVQTYVGNFFPAKNPEGGADTSGNVDTSEKVDTSGNAETSVVNTEDAGAAIVQEIMADAVKQD